MIRYSCDKTKQALLERVGSLAGLCLLVLTMFVYSPQPVFSQSIHWTGAAGDRDINNNLNWDPRLSPSAFLDLVVVPNVSLTSTAADGVVGRSLRLGGSFRFRPFAGGQTPFDFRFNNGLFFDGSNQVLDLGGSGNRRVSATVRTDYNVTSRNTILLSSGVDWLSTLNTVRFTGDNTTLQVESGSHFVSDSSLAFSQNASGIIRGGLTARNLNIESGSRVEIQTGASIDDGISPARLRIDGGTFLLRGNSTLDFSRNSPSSLIDIRGGGRFSSSGNSSAGIIFADRGGVDLIGGQTEINTLTLNNQSELNLFNNAQLRTNSLQVSGGSRLQYSSANSIALGELTLSNGTINTAVFDPITFGLTTVRASGQINAAISGNTSSSINLNGDLVLGDSTNRQGYDFRGTLDISRHRATLRDQDVAELGVETRLSNGGQLVSEHGFALGEGETLSATGIVMVMGSFQNNGIVNGSQVQGELLEFTDDVHGEGEFTGTILLSGSFNPGNSMAAVSFENLELGFNHQLFLELGGSFAGSEFDQLLVSGDATIDGSLEIALTSSFSLADGDFFEILQVGGTLTGRFQGLEEGDLVGNFGGQDLFITYSAGDGNDVALFTAIPEPGSTALVVFLAFAVIMHRRKEPFDQNGFVTR